MPTKRAPRRLPPNAPADPLAVANARVLFWKTGYEMLMAQNGIVDAEEGGTDEHVDHAIAEFKEAEREHEKARAALEALGAEP